MVLRLELTDRSIARGERLLRYARRGNVRDVAAQERIVRSRREPRRMLPPVTRKILAAVRGGTGADLFPPVARVHSEGVIVCTRKLAGSDAATCIERLLEQPRFAPFTEMLERLDEWCRSLEKDLHGWLDNRLLDVSNPELMGPLFVQAFGVCAKNPHEDEARRVLALRTRGFKAFMERFLERYQRDRRTERFIECGWDRPIRALQVHGEETHNGAQQVLRLQLSGGAVLAYKPRPATGERLFMAEDRRGRVQSVFGFLNARRPASGSFVLPVMRIVGGTGADGHTYSWHEWITRSKSWGSLRSAGALSLRGTRLPPARARTFWRNAGALSAMCYGFGITDLGEGNVVVGRRLGAKETLAYPVDLEVFFAPIERLYQTDLIARVPDRGRHHVGFENIARWCSSGSLPRCFFDEAQHLQLQLVSRPWARTETLNVVGTTHGQIGYAAFLTAFLRGMFDAWTTACRAREPLARFIARFRGSTCTRVLLRPTAEYATQVERQLHGIAGRDRSLRGFSIEEREHLQRLDVPYFFRSALRSTILHLGVDSKAHRARPTQSRNTRQALLSGNPDVAACSRLDLAGLGIALRDAVAYVLEQLPAWHFADARAGVYAQLDGRSRGKVSFDWIEVKQRVTYSWTARHIRMTLEPLVMPRVRRPRKVCADLRRYLLRIDRVDAALRDTWAQGGFNDPQLERQLHELTDAALEWLRGVIAKHGWPGSSLVGSAASAAACRVVQHIDDNPAFQRRCLALLRVAAAQGEVPWAQVAALTDALRLQQGKPQLYGTKFRRRGHRLEPFPIEREAGVDLRRRKYGLEPLREYAQRLRSRFPFPSGSPA